jgi:hypothetical protein
MTSHTSASGRDLLRRSQDFSLVVGGPLFQLLRRSHLSGDALQLVQWRIVVVAIVTWLPLLILSDLDGDLAGNRVAVPFVLDLETHIRFLVVVPLLLAAELVVHRRLLSIGRAFLERKLIREAEVPRFERAIRSAFRLRNSVLAEVLLVAFVYLVGILFVWRHYTVLPAATWYAAPSEAGAKLSIAGDWYAYVSLPLFQFLLVRWYFRLFIWTRFLWQVSRLDLSLVPTHPDLLGGLGFLANTVYAFGVLLAAHGAMVAGQVANRIFFAASPLTEFKIEIAVMAVFLLCIVFAPLLAFSPQLSRTKRTGLLEYGTFAERYVREFDSKWLRGAAPRNEPLVGSADIQSLADLANSFDVVRSMRLAPVTRDAVLQLAAAFLAPMVPLLLTVMPLEALLKKLFGLVF